MPERLTTMARRVEFVTAEGKRSDRGLSYLLANVRFWLFASRDPGCFEKILFKNLRVMSSRISHFGSL